MRKDSASKERVKRYFRPKTILCPQFSMVGHKNLVFIQMIKCEIHIFYTYFSEKGQNSTILAFLGGDLVE